jgi:hypothetical protein
MKSEGSAREYSPGHRKSEERSENKSKSSDKSDRADREGKRSEHNAKNDHEKSRSEHKATNERDHHGDRNRNEARSHERNGAAAGASEGAEGRSGGHSRGSITSVTTEQKTKIRSVFTRHHVEPARNLNVSVNVGVRIPHSVHLYPIPADVIEIVPEYRDYEYILLDDDRIAIIDPDTYEVVDIIVLT